MQALPVSFQLAHGEGIGCQVQQEQHHEGDLTKEISAPVDLQPALRLVPKIGRDKNAERMEQRQIENGDA